LTPAMRATSPLLLAPGGGAPPDGLSDPIRT